MADQGEGNPEGNNPAQAGPGDGEQERETPSVYWSATHDRAEQMDLLLRSGAHEVLDGVMVTIATAKPSTPEQPSPLVPCVWPQPEAHELIERLASTMEAAGETKAEGAHERGPEGEELELRVRWLAGVNMQNPDDSIVRLDLGSGDREELSLWFRAGTHRQILDAAADLRQLVVLAYEPAARPPAESRLTPGAIPMLPIRMTEEAVDSLIDMLRAIYPVA